MPDWDERGGGGRGRGRSRGRGGGGGGDRGDREDAGGSRGGGGGVGGGRGKIRGLTYTPAATPSFLKAFQAQLAGAPPPGSKDPYSSRSMTELGEDGQRAALPGRAGRQTSEEREEQDRLEGNEFGWGEGGDDAPQVVVLKEGKHLSLEEMEDEQRKVKGLPPIDRNPAPTPAAAKSAMSTSSSKPAVGGAPVAKTAKRKAVAVGSDGPGSSKGGAPAEKKKKKEKKGLLSFDEEG